MDMPTLAEYFAGPALEPVVKLKGLFSKKPNLSLLSAFYVGLVVYQQGAVLGYARNADMETLARLFATPGKEREACDYLIEASQEEIREYGGSPDNFIDFFTSTCAKPFASFWHPDTIKRLSKEQVRLGVALVWIEGWFKAGLGLGLSSPQLVEIMWKNGYESIDHERWEQLHRAGLDIPAQNTPLPLKEWEQVVLSRAGQYAREYVPDVVGPLRLT